MKIEIKHTILLITAIFWLSSAYAQKLDIAISRDSIRIGDEIYFSIQYPIQNASSSLSFQKGDSLGDGFEVYEVLSRDTVNGKDRCQLKITSFEPGIRSISPLSVFYDSIEVVSQPIPVLVTLVEIDTSKSFIDIHPIFDDPLTSAEKWQLFWNKLNGFLIYIGIGFLVLLLLMMFFIVRKRRKKIVPEEPIVVIPAHIKAKQRLEELKDKQLWQKGMQKEYNVQLTEIIQQYITDNYNVPTKEKTSSEILDSIRFVKMNAQNKNNLRQLLMLSDLVKFAKEKPTKDENDQVLKNAFDFIESTNNQDI